MMDTGLGAVCIVDEPRSTYQYKTKNWKQISNLAQMSAPKMMLAFGLLLGCFLLAGSVGCTSSAETEVEELEKSTGLLPKMFDFKQYLVKYGKHYVNPAEIANRMRLYFARAYKVFIRHVKFLYGLANSFLALNEMSDLTTAERRKLFGGHSSGGQTADLAAVDLDLLKEELKIVKELDGEPARKKRDTEEQQLGDLHELEALYKCRMDSEACRRRRRPRRRSGRGHDQLLMDFRDRCMPPVKHQGDCGSCYAFSALTVYEYQYCKQSGEPIEFSVQYVVDCGRASYLLGCDGGSNEIVGYFVRDYGLELASAYPYKAKERNCPYNRQDDRESMGYMRVNEDHRIGYITGVQVDNDMIKTLLEQNGPLGVGIRATEDLMEYGGGVDLLDHEEFFEMHALVMVGHGIEDGRAYWLMRNAWGPKWGENGYYKFDMESRRQNLDKIFVFQAQFHLNRNHNRRLLEKKLAKISSSCCEKLFGWMG